ncbi:thiol-disulfide oxidoreductase DCC family protein [Allorhodopirellula solitaria]|uniref:Thiol-disulfide oxidoreductase n=1 Tax=Allorhodopirellula solitaria TaxID=2527987 RepID=A0A5C5YJS4_9BACT|nr:DUF393 domain-containing protein [Allorhodopirellula solitaria]TWT75144.1 hypothetical protein CA85_04330 [Allorhodopirellula solitaria]
MPASDNTSASSSAAGGLPDPDEYSDRDVVIYDGKCNACSLAARRMHQLDFGQQRLAFLSLHDERVAERYPDLNHDELMAQMYVVDSNDNRHGGADAVRYLSRRLPMLWPLAPLLHIPGSANLWRKGYAVVAKNRYWISKKFFGTKNECESGSCSIHYEDPVE